MEAKPPRSDTTVSPSAVVFRVARGVKMRWTSRKDLDLHAPVKLYAAS